MTKDEQHESLACLDNIDAALKKYAPQALVARASSGALRELIGRTHTAESHNGRRSRGPAPVAPVAEEGGA